MNDTKFIVANERSTLIFSNWSALDQVAPYFVVTQLLLSTESPDGMLTDLVIGHYHFAMLVSEPYYFLACTDDEEISPFLRMQLITLKNLLFGEVGPAIDLNYLSIPVL